jgi:L-rhamnose mutarotase
MQDLSFDQLIHSSTGTGFANIDRKVEVNGLQRTYTHGSGDLVLDEKIGGESNRIEKSIKLIYKPTEFAVNPGNSLNLSSKWSEGVSSQTDDHILLSESFTDLVLMDKETEVTDLTNAETNVNYTGRGEFVIAGENYTSDEVYIGNYSLVRKVEIVQLPRYNKAHVTVTKQLYIDPLNCKIADYSIFVTNDGNSVLGPVFIRDTFPTSTSYLGSSEQPIELTTRIANWSIENLYPGEIKQIRLTLKIEKEVDKLTNRVRATAYYLDKSNKQSRTISNYNSTVLVDKNICTPGKLSVATTATPDKNSAGIIRYRSTVENLADYNVSVNLTSYLPEGASFLNSTPKTKIMSENNATWSFKLNAGKKRSITYYVQYNGSGLIESRAEAQAFSLDGYENLTAQAMSSVLIPEPKTMYVNRITGDWLPEYLTDPLLPVCESDGGPCPFSPYEDPNMYGIPVRTVPPSPGYTRELPCC